MRIVVFGISGRTGQALVAANGARAVTVTGVGRQAGELRSVLAGAGAVVCVFGPRPPYTEVFCADTTQRIVDAMKSAGVGRLLVQTGAMIGPLPPNVSWPMRWMAGRFAASRPDIAADRAAQEAVVRASGLDWTLVKPPRLTDGRPHGRVRAGARRRIGLLSSVSRADLAEFIIEEAVRPRFIGEAVYVCG